MHALNCPRAPRPASTTRIYATRLSSQDYWPVGDGAKRPTKAPTEADRRAISASGVVLPPSSSTREPTAAVGASKPSTRIAIAEVQAALDRDKGQPVPPSAVLRSADLASPTTAMT